MLRRLSPLIYLLILFILGIPNISFAFAFNFNTDQQLSQLNLNADSDGRVAIQVEVHPQQIKAGKKITLTIHGVLFGENHIYSTKYQGELAPEPTKVIIKNGWFKLAGKPIESRTTEILDPAFELKLRVHIDEFKIDLPLLVDINVPRGVQHLDGELHYQLCDNQICSLPIKEEFSTKIIID